MFYLKNIHPGPEVSITFKKTPGQVYVYALRDPDTGNVRYVGKTIDPRDRYQSYMSPSVQENENHLPVIRWVKKLREREHYPVMYLIECVAEAVWEERERHWISFYRAKGLDLLNIQAGGGGQSGFIRPQEVKDKISATLQGHPVAPETRQQLSEALTGRTAAPSTVAKVGAASARAWASLTPDEHAARVAKMRASRSYDGGFGQRVSEAKRGRRPNHPGAASDYLGVSKQKENPAWQVYVRAPEGRKYLGSYRTELGAASAYNRAAAPLGLPLNEIPGGEIDEPRLGKT